MRHSAQRRRGGHRKCSGKITTPIIELYPETAGERKLCIRGTIVKVVGFTGEEFKDLKVEIQYPPTPCWLAKIDSFLGDKFIFCAAKMLSDLHW